jgi:hypothetical protein
MLSLALDPPAPRAPNYILQVLQILTLERTGSYCVLRTE